ncbi:MAG: hypothetical protein WAO20_11665 [Acidobacteriota bacterium]
MNCSGEAGDRLTRTTGRLAVPISRSAAGIVGAARRCAIVMPLLLMQVALATVSPAPSCLQQVAQPAIGANQDYSVMSTMLRRGFLFVQVDVADVVVRFGEQTAAELRRLAQGRSPSPEVDEEIARTAMESKDAVLELTFQRDITLDRFVDEARRSTERVRKAGVIDRKTSDRIRQLLPFWYASLKNRGIKKGDRMCYRIQGDELHTLYVGDDGTIFADQINDGDGACLAVLGGYFVEGSDFRQGLIESLFGTADSQPVAVR